MKTLLPFQKILIIIIIILTINFNKSSAQSSSVNGSRLTSKSIVSLNGEWLIDKDPQDIGKIEKWWEVPASGAKPIKLKFHGFFKMSFRLIMRLYGSY